MRFSRACRSGATPFDELMRGGAHVSRMPHDRGIDCRRRDLDGRARHAPREEASREEGPEEEQAPTRGRSDGQPESRIRTRRLNHAAEPNRVSRGMAHRADLFDGRSQLFIKHFMLAPGQTGQCVGCSFEVDHLEGILAHLENHDVSYAVVARAPIEEIEAIRKRMGWRFTWVSSYHSDFNYDFNVSFRPHDVAAGHAYYNYGYTNPGLADRSGDSLFFKYDAGEIFHTYSTYGRGGEEFLGAYWYLDVMPKGRDENGPYRSLADWVRPRNMYGKGGMVEADGRYHVPSYACATHR